jgi:hypothetical protein
MIDLFSLYRFRDELTLFECVALAHGYIPRDLSDYAVQALWEKLYRAGDPELFSQCIDSHPEWAFPPEVAETASALKIMASAGSLTEVLTVDDCRQWLAELGLSLPWTPATQEQRETTNAEQDTARQILPRKPRKRARDAWSDVISATIDAFESEHGFTPTAREAWHRLVNTTPDGWSYNYRQDRNDCLMAGEKEPLDQATFEQRFRRMFSSDAKPIRRAKSR